MSMIVFAIVAGASLSLLAIGLLLLGNPAQKRLRARAKAIRERQRSGGRPSSKTQEISVLRQHQSAVPMVEALVKRCMPQQAELRNRLARTGYDLSIGTYALTCAAVGAFSIVALAILAPVPLAAAVLAGMTAGVIIPHLGLNLLAARRRKRFIALLPETIDLIVRGIRSGLPVTESIAIVGREIPNPVGAEFQRISDHIRLGRLPEPVLWEAAERLQVSEFNFFVISMSIQRETGGNLAETLNNLGDLLRKRRQMQLKIKAMSSEAKASAYILGFLPIGMFFLLHLLNPDYAATFYTDPRGKMLAGAAILSMVIAAVVMTKMIRFKI